MKRSDFFKNLIGVIPKRLGNVYANAYHKRYDRRTPLFMRPIKSQKITFESYLVAIISNVYRNAVHYEVCRDYEGWLHNSYDAYLLNLNKIHRYDVLDSFLGKNELIHFYNG